MIDLDIPEEFRLTCFFSLKITDKGIITDKGSIHCWRKRLQKGVIGILHNAHVS